MDLYDKKMLGARALVMLVDQVLVDQGYFKSKLPSTYLARTADGPKYMEKRREALYQLLKDAVVGQEIRRAREKMERPEPTLDTALKFEIPIEKCKNWTVQDFDREIKKELRLGSIRSVAVTLYKEKERFLKEGE